jgi:hypothetical protein
MTSPDAGSSAAQGGGGIAIGAIDAGATGSAIQCDTSVKPGLPAGAPALKVGTWVDIRPPGITWGENGHATGFAISACNPSVLYVGIGSFNSSTGVFRSTDAGGTWKHIATGGDPHLDGGAMTRIDPKDPKHLYFVEAVRGSMGFFRSLNAGDTIEIPQGFKDIGKTAGIYQWDVYDIDTDPTDFRHILLSFHGAWGWTDTKWNTNSGVLESTDGGDTWIVHEPGSGWVPVTPSTSCTTRRAGKATRTPGSCTQGAGMLRTTDAGKTWTKVTTANIQHGGGKIHYTPKGVLYATGGDRNIRSTDNGVTWSAVGPGGGYNAITGDGMNLYTAKCFGPTPMLTSPESDGQTWSDFNSQSFSQGPFEYGFDPVNGIVYASLWGDGVWALKVK